MGAKGKAARQAKRDAAYRRALGYEGELPRSAALGSGSSPEPIRKGRRRNTAALTKVTEQHRWAKRRNHSTSEPRVGTGPVAVARAEEALARNRDAIDSSRSGTPAGRASNYKIGRAPSSYG